MIPLGPIECVFFSLLVVVFWFVLGAAHFHFVTPPHTHTHRMKVIYILNGCPLSPFIMLIIEPMTFRCPFIDPNLPKYPIPCTCPIKISKWTRLAYLKGMWVVFNSFFRVSKFYRLDLYNITYVAVANLRRGTSKNQISLHLVMIIGSACFSVSQLNPSVLPIMSSR